MSIQACFLMPHGLEVIDKIFPKQNEQWKELTKAMRDIAEKIYALQPNVIVVASPHNLRIRDHIAIIATEHMSGELTNEKTQEKVAIDVKCDRKFAKELYKRTRKKGIPSALVNYGALEGSMSWLPLDWGTAIPLYFVVEAYQKYDKKIPSIVLVTPSRNIPWAQLIDLGEIIQTTGEYLDKKAIFIASADHGHAHLKDGPYGYDPAAKEYDKRIMHLIENNKLEELLNFSAEFLEKAKPDSFWQLLILLGCLKNSQFKCTKAVYQCPTYYGMGVASFE